MDKVPITQQGYEKLKKELERLIKIERPENIRAIETARAHGDLSENAEYHAAKERQGFIESRLSELQSVISRAEIIETDKTHERAIFGATVTLEDVNTGDSSTYQLVGQYESDPENGRISVTSPLGRALIGKEEGDEIKFKTPGGVQEMEIIRIV